MSHAFGGLIGLSDVSMRVAAGSIHALIGPNKSGKTSTINIVVPGPHRADSGRINVDGEGGEMASMHMGRTARNRCRRYRTLEDSRKHDRN